MSVNKGGRVPAGVRILREAEIVHLLVQGGTRRDALELAAEWGVSVRTGDRYLAAARDQIRSDWQLERPELLAQLLSQVSSIQQEAREKNQLGIALAAINTLARLSGLL